MAYTAAQARATRKYRDKAYDRAELLMRKGCKQVYQAAAQSLGMSFNAYVLSLLDADARELGFALPADDDADILIV